MIRAPFLRSAQPQQKVETWHESWHIFSLLEKNATVNGENYIGDTDHADDGGDGPDDNDHGVEDGPGDKDQWPRKKVDTWHESWHMFFLLEKNVIFKEGGKDDIVNTDHGDDGDNGPDDNDHGEEDDGPNDSGRLRTLQGLKCFQLAMQCSAVYFRRLQAFLQAASCPRP